MITKEEYKEYFGVDTAPSNLARLEFLSLNTIKSLITRPLPIKGCPFYDDFKRAVMEQINYYYLNSDLLDSTKTGGYTLGSYSESASASDTSESMDRLSPVAYEILLNCGLLQCSLGRCCCG